MLLSVGLRLTALFMRVSLPNFEASLDTIGVMMRTMLASLPLVVRDAGMGRINHITPPAMLQTALLEAWIKRGLIYLEHPVSLFFYLRALYQPVDGLPSGAPISFPLATFHLLVKLFKSTDDQPKFRLKRRFVGQLLIVFFEFGDAKGKRGSER